MSFINTEYFSGITPECFSNYINKKEFSKIILLCDSNTRKVCLPALITSTGKNFDNVIEIPPGEESKSLASCEMIWSKLKSLNAGRDSVLINLGGGMICDLGGFAASVYKRGIHVINIPTSLLAMVDASAGGKTGINFSGIKNIIGTFNSPDAVFYEPDFLKTLLPRHFKSGFAEVIKHALLSGGEFYRSIFENNDPVELNIEKFIEWSVDFKRAVVKRDPYDNDERQILNFGHTIGHAFESISLEETSGLLHGEAVAIGMVAELILSVNLFSFPDDKSEKIISYIINYFPGLNFDINAERVLSIINNDKKNSNNEISFSLLKDTGKPEINCRISPDEIKSALTGTSSRLCNVKC